MDATRSALVETGEHLSPKYTPDNIAPPVKRGSTFITAPIEAQITPIVAAVPKEVPVNMDIPLFSRKTIRRKTDGRISFAARQTIEGIVPDALQRAVIIPISRKINRIFPTVFIPLSAIPTRSRHSNPFRLP